MAKNWLRGLGGLAMVAVLGTRLVAQAPAEKPAAVVNGEMIPGWEVQALLKRQPPPPTPLSEAQKKEMEQVALEMLVEDALMRQFLAKYAPPLQPAELDKEITDLKQILHKEKQTYEGFLKDSWQTEGQLRRDIAARLQWKAYITPRLPDPVVKQYYDANKVFFDKVMVRASHILIKLPQNASPQERQTAHAKLLALKQEVVAGKLDFGEAAKKHSDCPSKTSGGDIGHFPYKFGPSEPFTKAAFALKVGDLSDVVATEFGYHLLRVTDRSKGEPSNYDKIKEQVRDIYSQEVYQSIIEQQRRAAKIDMPR
jgi:peptidyl-prolyl cis-trans isomerase C